MPADTMPEECPAIPRRADMRNSIFPVQRKPIHGHGSSSEADSPLHGLSPPQEFIRSLWIPLSPLLPDCRLRRGTKAVSQELQLIAGYRRAPLEMPYVWHAFSPGAERGNNDWMAMYQFQRKNLREKTGLKSFAPPPTATWQNVCTQAEIDAALKTAAELGFKRIALPWCPSPIEGIDSAKSLEAYRKVRSCGLIPFPWTAGDYSHGDSEEIYRNHKDWYLRDLDGKIFSYMKIHPVLDLNNRDFRKWYFGKMSNAIKAGAGAFYFDMYGAAIGNINYGRPGAEPGLAGACDIFRFFSDRNGPDRRGGAESAGDRQLVVPAETLQFVSGQGVFASLRLAVDRDRRG